MRTLKYGLLALGLTGLVACTQSPTGRSQLQLFSSDEIAQLGAQSYNALKQEEKISRDPALNSYVQCISDDLIAVLPEQWAQQQWEVTVFESEAVNAFALPGGKIGVYTGLIEVAENAAQLAAVIGHEIGHVIAQHSNERMSNQFAAGLGLQLGGILVGQEMDSDTAALVMGALGVGVQLGYILPYSRIHESESDELGLGYMAAAGYDPREAAELWRNMAQQAGPNPPEFLSTHPSPQTRIEKLEALAVDAMSTYRQAPQPSCRKP
ncbi:M48 family metallopeptidase [Pseudidiomarina terrestris]|uniref:M48 family metallopeptidase n=1 Tax=Pseudidiomarina terrestris TaxID=2820060 RepID=UPI0026567295|nr:MULTISPECIES: M48 family metallopeptidase [unclassified Pseudidiomarina]MDN7127862.1 M48 family metallopeptidase [Pseudidiomarina sp. 1APR75-33.1]MDN7134768.1 M48 family metallopeptidase [Pseudidiomarina sp. 1ASP75-5]MDN7137446.1 M48 family metallopeptidase [Pseudidiomarina sp. 1ASP75-14]MEA3587444.1 M48 family metallopeptidase [Pseudidiomarina sp. 1APP75-27a]